MSEAQRQSLPNDHCRDALVAAQPTGVTHAGLWLDKFFTALPESEKLEPDKRKWELADMAAALPAPEVYGEWYKRWRVALGAETLQAQTEDYHAVAQPFAVQGRMVVGLGADAPLENSITLHHTYGVPYIPGSALKGLAASYAYNHLATSAWRGDPSRKADRTDNSSDFYKTLFGSTDEAGFITFFDALYIPGSAEGDRPLRLDVLTVHHQEYYQGNAPPADWDSPIPVPFLSAVGSYLIVLAGPKLWVAVALNLLTLALIDVGIGAKTSSGYGRMRVVAQAPSFARQAFVQPPRRQRVAQPPQQREQRQTLTQAAAPNLPAQARASGVIKSLPPNLDYGYITLDDDQGRGDARFYFDRVTAGTPRVGRRVTCRLRLVNERWRAEDVRIENQD
jgi:CRISPR-associated protein Cmr6